MLKHGLEEIYHIIMCWTTAEPRIVYIQAQLQIDRCCTKSGKLSSITLRQKIFSYFGTLL